MTTILLSFILAFAVAVVATRLMMIVAWKVGAVDRPDGYRKLHKQATPRLGGFAVAIAVCVPIVGLLLFPQISQVSRQLNGRGYELFGLLVCSAMALIVGGVDDVSNLRARWKLFWQIIIAITAFMFGFTIRTITNPFGSALDFGILSFPVTVFWFVGCMNAVNLLDGLDGLAAGTCLFVFMTLFLLGVHFNNTLVMLVMASGGGAVLGFLVFNFPPARIFLGDSGSMLLGFLVGALSLIGTSRKAEAAVALFVPVVTLGVPILDTTLAIVRRWYKRLPISSPDRGHIHHVLVGMGYSQRRAVLTLYAICVLLAGAALLMMVKRNDVVIFVIGSLVVMTFVSARIFGGVRMSDIVAKLSRDRVRNDELVHSQMVLERAIEDVKSACDLDRLWRLCATAFKDIGYDYVRMEVAGRRAEGGNLKPEVERSEVRDQRSDEDRDGGPAQASADNVSAVWAREWKCEPGEAGDSRCSDLRSPTSDFCPPSDRWRIWLSLKDGERVLGCLTVGRSSGTDSILPELSGILDHFRREVERALLRNLRG